MAFPSFNSFRAFRYVLILALECHLTLGAAFRTGAKALTEDYLLLSAYLHCDLLLQVILT